MTQTGRKRVSGSAPAPSRPRAGVQGSARRSAPDLRSIAAPSLRRPADRRSWWNVRPVREAGMRPAGWPLAVHGLLPFARGQRHGHCGRVEGMSRPPRHGSRCAEACRPSLVAGMERQRHRTGSLNPGLGVGFCREPRLPGGKPGEGLNTFARFNPVPAGDARNAVGPGSGLGTGNRTGRPGGNSRIAFAHFATHRRTELSRCLPANCGALSVQQRPQGALSGGNSAWLN